VAAGEDRLGGRGATRQDDRDAGPDRASTGHERSVAIDEGRVTDLDPGDVCDRVVRAGLPATDGDAQVSRPHPGMLAAANRCGAAVVARPYHRPVIPTDRPTVELRLRRLPERIASARAIDLAERFRDLPGLVLLESARPGRNARWTYLCADPVAVLETPAAGPDPFAVARALVSRLDRAPTPTGSPPFLGGLAGFLGYDLGASFERLPAIAPADQDLPPLRLALHDWVVAWDRREGVAWLGGRALDGDQRRLAARLDDVHARLTGPPRMPSDDREGAALDPWPGTPFAFRSGLDRAAYEAGVERVREHIARGDLYQANLTRRLETAFDGDPWELYRRLRTGDPSLFSAYLDLGRGQLSGRPRALLSASPEPFLAVDPTGVVSTDPIKGTRPRGRDRVEDRALACELLASAKDRAENVMIVDVLRNDLGRVCRPGSVRVPRLCRLERTATVQHLVSTVTGRLDVDRDAFDLLAASFPGGSITGAPKIRAMEILEGLEPVRRGPYTGAIGWIGPDGAMQTSIAIRTFVADGRRLTLHVGGGITWKSDPAAEWEETVSKARGPLGAIGGTEVA
jgi:para-aminobenzoate synthetase component 1